MLSGAVADMAQRMHFDGRVTNHSLRATSASLLYCANGEEIVKEHTGHRSDSVRDNKRTSEHQMYQCNEILYGTATHLLNKNVKCLKIKLTSKVQVHLLLLKVVLKSFF